MRATVQFMKADDLDVTKFAPRPSDFFRISIAACLVTLVADAHGALASTNAPVASPPVTPRQFFNAGTQKLGEGKLSEAESFLESTLASQKPTLQPPALYNLGHVRFRQGTEALKKSLAAGPAASSARRAE